MFYHHDINGADLPPRTLVLTYDDGPGRDTPLLARFLASESVQAAFFVIGRHARQFPGAMHTLRDLQHVIGNHTDNHLGIVDLVARGGDVVEEVSRADREIRPFAGQVIYFRPPYGSWRNEEPSANGRPEVSAAADILNRSGRFNDYVGPIMWDITGGDWGCWERGDTVDDCLNRYLEEIELIGRGIVLMHDSSETPEFAARNQTFAATKRLVPDLKRRGFRFVSLDAIPTIAGRCASEAGWGNRV
jgi:peptidoglycan/xylan/chitin deacetylase (PgdA/CDA1 family)